MTFELFVLRLHYRAESSISFPPGMAGNRLRGALGAALHAMGAAYQELFAPAAADGPSGFRQRPRPFVVRAAHLDGAALPAGARFHFDLHVFPRDPEVRATLTRAFAGALAGARLEDVEETRCSLALDPPEEAVPWLAVRFLTPTELKFEGGIASRPDFPILAARVRDRLAALCRFYRGEPLPIDPHVVAAAAQGPVLERCEVRHVSHRRHSRRTGEVHPLGGFVGEAEYRGDLRLFLPLLETAQFTGVGRHTAWGQGAIAVVR